MYVDVAVWGAEERVQKLGRDELFQAWECWNPWLGLPWLSGEPCGTQGIVLPPALPARGAFDCGLFPKGCWELPSVGD